MLVSEEMVQQAFDWLNENASTSAAARANRVRAEYHTKAIRSEVFLEKEGNNLERESKTFKDRRYKDAVRDEMKALEEDQFHINQRNKCMAIIDAWRTEQSNYRAMQRVG